MNHQYLEIGQEVVFVGPDGHPLIPTEQLRPIELTVSSLPENVFFKPHNLIFNFLGLPLSGPGQCEIRILVDKQLAKTIPFQIVQVPGPTN